MPVYGIHYWLLTKFLEILRRLRMTHHALLALPNVTPAWIGIPLADSPLAAGVLSSSSRDESIKMPGHKKCLCPGKCRN